MAGFFELGKGWQRLADGWGRISLDNTAGAGPMYANFFSKPLAEVPQTATALLEVRNLSGEAVVYGWSDGPVGYQPQLDLADAAATYTLARDGALIIRLARGSGDYISLRNFVLCNAGKSCTVEARISLYAGDYAGPYVPYIP